MVSNLEIARLPARQFIDAKVPRLAALAYDVRRKAGPGGAWRSASCWH
jgi:hypothetical protein